MTLKQFARDWSTDGAEERQQCYAPIINEIEKFYSADKMYVYTYFSIRLSVYLSHLFHQSIDKPTNKQTNKMNNYNVKGNQCVLKL